MDNITHSLFGAVLAETAVQLVSKTPEEAARKRKSFYFVSILGANFPDFDLVMQLFESIRLGYMLNHRGYTHSIFFLLPQLLLVLGLAKLIFKNKITWQITALAVVALLSHVWLDYLNSYGIHLFAGVDDHWFYKDSVYIIEPWYWVALMPLMMLVAKSKIWRLGIPAFLCVMLGFGAGWKVISAPLALCILAATGATYFAMKRLSPRVRPWLSLALAVSVMVVFISAQSLVRQRLTELYGTQEVPLIDITLSPLPGNALCWSYLAVHGNSERYKVVVGNFQLFASENKSSCLNWVKPEGFTLQPPDALAAVGITEIGKYESSLQELFKGYETSCQLQAWFRVSRVPARAEDTLDDLRYAIKSKNNFSTFKDDETTRKSCLNLPSPWIPPRKDLLDLYFKNRS